MLPSQLSSDDIKKLTKTFATVYQSWQPFIDALYDINIPHPRFSEIPNEALIHSLAAVVKQANTEGWLPKLISAALAKASDEPVLQEFDLLLRPRAVPAGIDCFEVCRLTGRYVMIDREALRGALRELSRTDGNRILVVSGAPRTGASHSVQLISYTGAQLKTFRWVFVDLDAFNPMRDRRQPPRFVQPRELAIRLVKLLELDLQVPEPPTDSQWADWVVCFCDLFDIAMQANRERHWIVVDAFNQGSNPWAMRRSWRCPSCVCGQRYLKTRASCHYMHRSRCCTTQ